MEKRLSSVVVTAIMLGAWPAFAQEGETFVGAHGATVPETYSGSDMDVDWHLDIWPNQTFHLVQTPSDDGGVVVHAGRWHADGRNLLLDLGNETLQIEVRNADRLRPEGSPDDASGDLVGTGGLDPAPISLPVAGMFTYYADAASFVHCATGRSYPVMQDGAYLELERSYLDDRSGPAEPLFVTLDATIASRPQMEGPARLSVIVDDVHATWPGESCALADAAPGLSGTVWRPRSIESGAVDWAPPAREPYLVFDSMDGRFNASVGCNTILGGYSASEGALSFSRPASTMMACPDDLAELESRLIAAMTATASYMLGGRALRLMDEAGDVTAEFEAVYLP